MSADNCPICSTPWPEHDGPTRLCAALQSSRKALAKALEEVEATKAERDLMAVNRMWMRLCDGHRQRLLPEGPCVVCHEERLVETNFRLRAALEASTACLEAVWHKTGSMGAEAQVKANKSALGVAQQKEGKP